MKKRGDVYLKRTGETGKYEAIELPQTQITGRSSQPKKRRRKREDPSLYDEDDLRRIVAEGRAKSIDPYNALLASGVIKMADEFFEDGDQ
jgi:hypothetical protein